MAGPRVTGPVAKLARSFTTTAQRAALRKTSAPLSRKYADLLKERNVDPDRSRHIYTRSSNPPYPQPRKLRLMQTFSTSAAPANATAKSIDNMVFPGSAVFDSASHDPYNNIRVPLLPDNAMFQHSPEPLDAPVTVPEISIVAANPDLVSPSALTEIEGMGVDGIELKFIHDAEPAERQPHMLTDMWKGLVDDVFHQSKGKLAL
ncbi:hypothetical protein GGS21DRAFT_505988 [Xylaria nigripes]|nr:hypothetical protein GGS21DRAFT_505988 [Xylaria nigripes]